MDHYLLGFLCFLISLTPAFYLSMFPEFIIIPNKNCNQYLMRFLYICFPLSAVFFIFFGPVYSLIYVYGTTHPFVVPYEPLFDLTIVSIISILLSWFIKVRYIPTETPDEFRDDFYNHPLYIFCPPQGARFSSKVYGTKYVYPKGRKTTELLYGTRIGDVFLDLNILNSYPPKSIVKLLSGETIIPEDIFDIITENKLTGLNAIPVIHKGDARKNPRSYFLLEPFHTMMPLSPPTEIIVSNKFYLEIYVKNAKYYYSRSAAESALDFNQTDEIFGTHELGACLPGRELVLSGKAVKILIEQAGVDKSCFIPVNITEDSEISDKEDTRRSCEFPL